MSKFWEKVKKYPDKWIFIILFISFCISMIPILYISRYAVPSCDDYSYIGLTHEAWISTHSVWRVLKAAFDTAVNTWLNWEGTYSSIFFTSLSPCFISEKWYFLSTFILSGMLGAGISVMLHVILKKYAGVTNGYQRGICILVVLFLVFQTMVSPVNGLYWYNGALHYIIMESVLFFQTAVLLSFIKSPRAGRWLYLVISLPLAPWAGRREFNNSLAGMYPSYFPDCLHGLLRFYQEGK